MSSKSERLKLLQADYDVLRAQNERLVEENIALRKRVAGLGGANVTDPSVAAANVEARILAMKLEDERDSMFENFERLKRKYNTLHDAYVEKVKRCKALEDTFARQKTLTGLVMRSPIDQRMMEQVIVKEQRTNAETVTAQLELKVTKLKADLDEAYDIIDELEFELESIDFLEMENQRLQNEVRELKAQYAALPQRRPSTVSSDSSECSASADVIDAAQLERVAYTENLIKTAEAESNCLRRELLRSRLKNALRTKPPVPPKPKSVPTTNEL